MYNTMARMRVSRTIQKPSHGFLTGQAVYLNQQGNWELAKANSELTLGIGVIEVVDKNKFNVIFNGLIYGLKNLTRVGDYYFVSDTVAGQLTPNEPTSSSSFSNPLLFLAMKDTGIVLNLRPEPLALPDVKFESEAQYPLKADATTISLDPDNSSQGDLLFRNADKWERLPAGSKGQVLTTNGSGEDPSWSYSIYQSYISIQLQRASTNYAANTTYYIGTMTHGDLQLLQNENIQKFKSPINGRIVKINHIIYSESGSPEPCFFKVINCTKNTNSQIWSLAINATNGTNNLINLNLDVEAGDDLSIIMNTAQNWSAAPTNVYQTFIIYIEPSYQNTNYLYLS